MREVLTGPREASTMLRAPTTGISLFIFGVLLLAGVGSAFAPAACSSSFHPRARRLAPLSISKKEKEIRDEERRRVDERKEVQYREERGKLKRGLEASVGSGDGLTARNLLRGVERGNNPSLAEDAELLTLTMRACSKGGRHRDVIDFYDKLKKSESTDANLDALALIASASIQNWKLAEPLLRSLLAAPLAPSWAEEVDLRASALATAEATGNSNAVVRISRVLSVPTPDEVTSMMAAHLKAGKPRLAIDLYDDSVSGSIQLGTEAHEQALDALRMIVEASEQDGSLAAAQALGIIEAVRVTGNIAALQRCLEATVNIYIAGKSTAPQDLDMTFSLFVEANSVYERNHCNAATVSAMMIRSLANTTAPRSHGRDSDHETTKHYHTVIQNLRAFEMSAFAADAAPLTVDARMVLVDMYGLIPVIDPDESNIDRFGQDLWGNRSDHYDASLFFASARHILSTFNIDENGIFDSSAPSTVPIVVAKYPSVGTIAITALMLSPEISDQHQAFELVLYWCKSELPILKNWREMFLYTMASNPSQARSLFGVNWYSFLASEVSRAKAYGHRLPQDVCHKLLLERNSKFIGMTPYGAKVYLHLVRDLTSLCVGGGGLKLDAWYMAISVAAQSLMPESPFAGCDLIDEIAVEALNSDMALYAGKGGGIWLDDGGSSVQGSSGYGLSINPSVNLWEWTNDTTELWKWECFLAKASAACFASLFPPSFFKSKKISQMPTWFIPTERSELSSIIRGSRGNLDGFLHNYRLALLNQCRRQDVLNTVIDLVADGQFQYEVDGFTIDLFGKPLFELMLNPPPQVTSPIQPLLIEGHIAFNIGYVGESINGIALIETLSRAKPHLLSCGLGAEFEDWARLMIKYDLKDRKQTASDMFRRISNDNLPVIQMRRMKQKAQTVSQSSFATSTLLKDIQDIITDADLQELLRNEVDKYTDDVTRFMTATVPLPEASSVEIARNKFRKEFLDKCLTKTAADALLQDPSTKPWWDDCVGSVIVEERRSEGGSIDDAQAAKLLDEAWELDVKKILKSLKLRARVGVEETKSFRRPAKPNNNSKGGRGKKNTKRKKR